MRNVIVIGSGLGGMAAALRMRAKGYNVTLLEKQPDLGGRARVFKRNGFVYDAGPTVVTAPYLFEELFSLFNKDYNDYLKLVPLEIWYRFVFHDNKVFDYNGNNSHMHREIEKFNRNDINGYEKLVNFTKKIFDKGYMELSDVSFANAMFMTKQIPALLKLKSYKSVYKLVSDFIDDSYLRRVFSMHPLLVGGNPYTTTSIYTLILYLEKLWGIYYAMGGTGAIINAFERLMNEENITIIKSANVTEITTTNQKVSGVVINNEKYLNADSVICNVDPPFVYKNLIKDSSAYNFIFKQKMKRMDYSMGLFVYYFGSHKQYRNVQHHTIVYGKTYKTYLEKIFNQKILCDDISFYLHRPTATDPSMAPHGKDTFYVLVPVPNNLSKLDWSSIGEEFKELILSKMDQTVLPGIKNYVTEDFYVTPDYFEKDLSTLHGSGFSVQPRLSQSAYFRFHNQSEIIDNLFFVGAGTHPGAGMPGVLSSAKIVEKQI